MHEDGATAELSLLARYSRELIELLGVDGTIRYASPAHGHVLGLESRALEGRSVFDIVDPADAGKIRDALSRLKHNGDSVRVEMRLQSAEGPVWMDATLALVDGVDTPGALLAAREATDRRRAADMERQLRRTIGEAMEEWQSTFDASDSPIFVFGESNTLRRLNRAALNLLGGTYQDHLGKPIGTLCCGPLCIEMAKVVALAKEGQRSRQSHCSDREHNRTWALTASPVPARDGGGERVVVVAKDVTSLIELQNSLRRSELMSEMGALVAGVAHEVRAPLWGLASALDVLEGRLGSAASVADELRDLRCHLDRLKGLTRELLDYGAPACRTLALSSLAAVTEGAVQVCKPLAASLGVPVLQAVPAGLPPVVGDAKRLETVFRNLIENAIQHSTPSGPVLVSARAIDIAGRPGVRCAIQDSGKGFHEGDLEQAFEPFFSRRRGGTGLGLAIVRRVVEGHGGRVSAGNLPGGGAVLTVDLPCTTGTKTGPRRLDDDFFSGPPPLRRADAALHISYDKKGGKSWQT